MCNMLGNKVRNEAIKAVIKSDNLPHEAAGKCGFIECQERLEYFSLFLNEYNEWMALQQMQQAAMMEFLRGYKR